MAEIKSYNPQRFHHFLAHLTRLVDQNPDEAQALDGAAQLLGDLVSSDDWLLPDFAHPHPLHYQQYLLFADPQDRFSVVSFVWGPGQYTPIHDHTVWGLIGMLRGSEMCQSYSRMSDGRWAPAGLQIQMIPGDVEAVSPRLGDVHRVWNAFSDQVSISIHVYGANIGKVQRSIYYEDGARKTFISGYSNVPEMFSGLVTEHSFSPSAPALAPSLAHPNSHSATGVGGASVPTAQSAAVPKSAPTVPAVQNISDVANAFTASKGSTTPKVSPAYVKPVTPTQLVQKGPSAVQKPVKTNISTPTPTSAVIAEPKLVAELAPAPRTHLIEPTLIEPTFIEPTLIEDAAFASGPAKEKEATGLATSNQLGDSKSAGVPLSSPTPLTPISPRLTVQFELPLNGSELPDFPDLLLPTPPSANTLATDAPDVMDAPLVAASSVTSSPPSEPLAPATPTLTSAPAPAPALESVESLETPLPDQAPAPEPIAKIGGFELVTPLQVRNFILAKTEIALIDAREEDSYAQSHPLFACNLPISRTEADVLRRIPRKDTLIVIYDNSEGLALRSAEILKRLGYTRICLLEGGLSGWAAAGGELFKDVNVPSKAFGEWVETFKRTPSLPASEVKALIEAKADVVVLDARRFDEYQTMSIPGAISVPGAELVMRARTIAPKPTTRIIVNCAGRTRSIIGAQSLVNAGIPNPVCALRNGTIGWMLAGQELVKGAQARFPEADPADLAKAQASTLALAFRSGIKRIELSDYFEFKKQVDRTTYLFDVRTPEEFAVSRLSGALSAPGGQLVQETDHYAPVRGARIVLYDTDGVRAYMTGSWLVQLGWEVCVIKNISPLNLTPAAQLSESDKLPPTIGAVEEATPAQVKEWIANRTNLTLVIDVGDSAQYVKRHIPGAWWILRSQMQQDFTRVHKANRYVLTCTDGKASRYAVEELKQLVRPGVQVLWLKGGNAAWVEQGFSTQQGESYVVSPRIDRYRRPYEGTQNPVQAMQAYLDWEYGLVDQLKRDGTHGFKLI